MKRILLAGLVGLMLGTNPGCGETRYVPSGYSVQRSEPEACSQIEERNVYWLERIKPNSDGSYYLNDTIKGDMNFCIFCRNSDKKTMMYVNPKGVVEDKGNICPIDMDYGLGEGYLVRLCAMPSGLIDAYQNFCQEDLTK